jgi:asparagine synthase (glutamine-hydrolysing)
MCGIIGIIDKESPTRDKNAQAMSDRLEHRGPDGFGLATFPDCVLGHRRLSIVDIKTGGQPMWNKQKTVAITFNGEIYGYQDIKKKLSYPFETTSDTEVILALYETHGENFLKELPGMFAFAIWDDKEKKLIAGRDRLGEKPFYYAIGTNGEFIFASEIKAVLASGLIKPKLDNESLAHYLKKLYVHPSKTIYENIHVLPPAHMLVYKNGQPIITRYWKMPQTKDSISIEEALPEFKKLLINAVQKELVADVPVGAFLSGGLDSTTIVSIASKLNPNLETFSFGFGGAKNELPFARAAAKLYQTKHHELYDEEESIGDLLVEMAGVYDEPFADSSNIPTYLLSKLTSKHTKVVLSGDGGDELFGGYTWYRSLLEMKETQYSDFPGKLLFMRIIAQIAMRTNLKNKVNIISRTRGFSYQKKFSDVLTAHQASNVYFKDDEVIKLGIKSAPTSVPPSWKPTNTVDDAMKNDLEDYLPGDILVKTDRASMAHGLELRAPFLDIPLVEFAVSLPYRLKISSAEDKIILRRAFATSWPEAIQKRDKAGFGAPVKQWLKRPDVSKLIDDYLNNQNKKIFNYISFSKSRPYVNKGDYQTWVLLVLSIWMEENKLI